MMPLSEEKNRTTRRETDMALQAQEQETLNVKLVHFTKQNSTDEPVQVAFSVTDEQGKEEIITGEIHYSYDHFRVFQENGWLNIRRSVASIRESRTQRRTMSAWLIQSSNEALESKLGSGAFLSACFRDSFQSDP